MLNGTRRVFLKGVNLASCFNQASSVVFSYKNGHHSFSVSTYETNADSGRNSNQKPFVIGVAGPSGSGKTFLTKAIEEELENVLKNSWNSSAKAKIIRVCQDSFYRVLTPHEYEQQTQGIFNFDHPDALDISALSVAVEKLIKGKEDVYISGYNYSTCLQTEEGSVIHSPPFDLLILEGTLILYFEKLRNLCDLKVYVDTDKDICLERRIQRDRVERGRTLEHILLQYFSTVKPAAEKFCIPSKQYADITVNGGLEGWSSRSSIVQIILRDGHLHSNDYVGDVMTRMQK